MSKVQGVWKELKNVLENDATLKTYIKKVFEGFRKESAHYDPCIVIEPVAQNEKVHIYPEISDTEFRVSVLGFMRVYPPYEDQQMVGTSKKGLLDIETDIKKALAGNLNLNGKVSTIEFPATRYLVEEWEKGSIRVVEIEVLLKFRQGYQTRE